MGNQALLEQTQVYWRISSIWNGRLDRSLQVGDGLKLLNETKASIGPHRLLQKYLQKLSMEIVMNPRRKKPKKLPPPLQLAHFRESKLTRAISPTSTITIETQKVG